MSSLILFGNSIDAGIFDTGVDENEKLLFDLGFFSARMTVAEFIKFKLPVKRKQESELKLVKCRVDYSSPIFTIKQGKFHENV